MEFDIGNILYILITLVAVTVGLLGKKKKPGGQGTGEGGQRQPGFLENLEKAFNMGQQEQPIGDLSEYEDDLQSEYDHAGPMPEQGSEGLTLMQEHEQLLARNRAEAGIEESVFVSAANMASETLRVVNLEEVEDLGTDYFEVVKDFDAGTAVVYSAIINRVDY